MNDFFLVLAGILVGIPIFASCVIAGQYSSVWGVLFAIIWMGVAYLVVGVGVAFWAYAGTQIVLFFIVLALLALRAIVRKS